MEAGRGTRKIGDKSLARQMPCVGEEALKFAAVFGLLVVQHRLAAQITGVQLWIHSAAPRGTGFPELN